MTNLNESVNYYVDFFYMKEIKREKMARKIEIKKEIEADEFEKILSIFKDNISTCDDAEEIIQFSENICQTVKEIIPASEVFFLLLHSDHILENVSLDKRVQVDLSVDTGVIADTCKRKKSIFLNSINNKEEYDEKIDNLTDNTLKDLLLVPFMDQEERVVALIWCGIYEGTLSQYVKQDLDYIKQFSEILIPLLSDGALVEIWNKSLNSQEGIWKRLHYWFSN